MRALSRINRSTLIARLNWVEEPGRMKKIVIWWGGLENNGKEGSAHASDTPGDRPLKEVMGLLLSAPILLAFLFWVCLAVFHDGIAYFSVAALDQLFAVPLAAAPSARRTAR